MSNISFFFAEVKGFKPWEDSDESLKPLKDKLSIFFEHNFIIPLSINIVWFDYAALMSDDTISRSLDNTYKDDQVSDTNYVKKGYYKPSIIIGTQSLDLAKNKTITVFDKKLKQFDNNIYTYYCQIDKWEVFEYTLLKCLERINLNYALKLYDSQVTKEYYEFYLRMVRNNHLNGGHSSAVIPFVFTSEQEMDFNVLEYAERLKDYIRIRDTLSLNLLLVDDHAIKPLSEINKPADGLKNKTEILQAVWKKFTDYKKVNIILNIKAIEEPDINGLNNLPDHDTPDIILLDYNFNKPKSGVDFIKSLTEGGSKRWGPFNKFWIFPVTSFSSSFIDELQNQRLGFIHEDYELSRGADFINTPNLFLFYMMQMIWDIIVTSDLTVVTAEIDRVSEKLDSYTSWDAIRKAKDDFEKDYSHFVNSAWHIEHILEAKTGILSDIRKSLERDVRFIKRLNICKELLFNLTSKNYEGNDDIIILINELKRTAN